MGHSGLNLYDNTARMHDPILRWVISTFCYRIANRSRFYFADAHQNGATFAKSFDELANARSASPDPLFGKYPDTSPWSHCSANPLNAIDPDGREVFATKNSQHLFKLMLPSNLQNKIQFDSNGRLTVENDAQAMESSLVYRNLSFVANHENSVTVDTRNEFSYIETQTGNHVDMNFSVSGIEYSQPVDKITHFSQLGIGEDVWYGTTIVSNGEIKSSLDGGNYVIMNPALSDLGKAQGLGHELLGHVFMYFLTGNPASFGHTSFKSKLFNDDVNTLIINVVNEIIDNQKTY